MATPPVDHLETVVTILYRALAGLAAGAAGTLLAAALYTETHHAPDQS